MPRLLRLFQTPLPRSFQEGERYLGIYPNHRRMGFHFPKKRANFGLQTKSNVISAYIQIIVVWDFFPLKKLWASGKVNFKVSTQKNLYSLFELQKELGDRLPKRVKRLAF